MEIKIDAKCPRCGAKIQFCHTSEVTKKPYDLEFFDKTFEIGRASSLSAATRKIQPERSNTGIIRSSAQGELMDYFNSLFRVVGHAEGKKELLKLKKQVAKTKLRIRKKIENEFKQGKAEVLKEIDNRLKNLDKKRDKKGLAYRGIFDEKKKK